MKRMQKMKVYKVYMEDTVADECYKVIVPAYSEEDAIDFVNGNGEIISIKETSDYPISESKLTDTLKASGYGKSEVLIITRALSQIGLLNLD